MFIAGASISALIYSGALIALMLVLPNGVLSLLDRKRGPQMTAPILQVKGVTLKRYGGLTANNDISFDVAPQEILSVIGPNGGGEIHAVQADRRVRDADDGEVIYKGTKISACRRTRWRGWGWCGPSRRRRSSSR